MPVLPEEPRDSLESYVLFEKMGRGRSNHICAATITLKSYAPSLFKASLLNEQVKAAMDDLICLDEICRSELNSDYNFTDTASKRYRYQAVYDIKHY